MNARAAFPAPMAGRIAAALRGTAAGSVGRRLLEALAEGPRRVAQLREDFYPGAEPRAGLRALRHQRDQLAGMLLDHRLEIAGIKQHGPCGATWLLREVGTASPAAPVRAGALRHADRRVDWTSPGGGGAAVLASLAAALEALPTGGLLVYHLGTEPVPATLKQAVRQVLACGEAALASWPEDPPAVDPRRWSHALRRLGEPVGKTICDGGF